MREYFLWIYGYAKVFQIFICFYLSLGGERGVGVRALSGDILYSSVIRTKGYLNLQ